ncbi:Down syndrome cell adhesion molecule-like protein Dscam2 [Leptotrombidium deliense]|uniref:Down syndrome cell adhesion molecule-like protein Dscam2 n=1 Tax=Leptotrombidium deliense TaxID=299467 RepID=A0A443SI57_9ACAR|nr:Down syndrome cell adhesion molecule-like protein Dscam2 [Leptotrombidium deliense]
MELDPGSVKSSNSLYMVIAAHFDSKFRADTARKGQEVRLKCQAVGDKPLTINWLKDKLTFTPQEDPRYELNEIDSSDGLVSEIYIRNTDRRDSALYSCITSNSYGHDDTNIQLIMQEPPDPPQDVKVTEIDGRSTKVLWAPAYGGNSPIQQYIVQHKAEGGTHTHSFSRHSAVHLTVKLTAINILEKWGLKSGNVTVPGSETSLTIRNLRPVTHYQLRVFAVNSIGKSEQSEVKHFRTDEEGTLISLTHFIATRKGLLH